MKNNSKVCLFGGALMAAGMSAQAQSFIYADTDTTATYSSLAYSSAYGGALDIAYRPASLDTFSYGYSYYTGGTTMTTSQTATSMAATGTWDGSGYSGYGYGKSVMQQYFQVSANAQLLIEWDVSGTDGYAGTVVFEDISGTPLFSWSGLSDPLSGSALVNVSAGVDYGLLFGLYDLSSGFGPFIFSSTETQYISVTLVPVPAPGAASLLGLGGLVATRRRRR